MPPPPLATTLPRIDRSPESRPRPGAPTMTTELRDHSSLRQMSSPPIVAPSVSRSASGPTSPGALGGLGASPGNHSTKAGTGPMGTYTYDRKYPIKHIAQSQ